MSVSNAPPTLVRETFSTYVLMDGGIKPHEVPLNFPHISKPTNRIFVLGEEKSVPFLVRSSSEPKKLNQQIFTSGLRSLIKPVILMIILLVSRAKKVHDLHTLVEGFGLNMEGRALAWF